MKLKYSMLWFDDDKDQFSSYDFDDLITQINSWGFDFDSPTYVQTVQEFMDKAPFTEFDLIVVDYNIGEDNEHGDDFIQKVREQKIYTEVVFYTAGDITKLWESVKEKRLEGVFLSNANSITQKVLQVAKQSVKKVVDLENMRGIVMAQVGDIDLIMKDLLETGLAQLDDAKLSKIYHSFIKQNMRSSENKCTEIQQFSEKPSIEKMLTLCDGSSPIWNLAQSLQKRHPKLKGFDISNYYKEILEKRNALAHGVPQSQEDRIQIFKHKGYEFKYSENSAQQIRNDLKRYMQIYGKMLKEIS